MEFMGPKARTKALITTGKHSKLSKLLKRLKWEQWNRKISLFTTHLHLRVTLRLIKLLPQLVSTKYWCRKALLILDCRILRALSSPSSLRSCSTLRARPSAGGPSAEIPRAIRVDNLRLASKRSTQPRTHFVSTVLIMASTAQVAWPSRRTRQVWWPSIRATRCLTQ